MQEQKEQYDDQAIKSKLEKIMTDYKSVESLWQKVLNVQNKTKNNYLKQKMNL